MTKITLDQFIEQWCPLGSASLKSSQFEFDVEEFTTRAGQYALYKFKRSFALGSFCGNGPAWKARESAWGKRFTHKVLRDSRSLENSITGVRYSNRGSKSKVYYISTNEYNQASSGKRGQAKDGSIGYAAVHNTDESSTPYTVNQHSSRKPVQRQFIGHNDGVLNHINTKLVNKIFSRLP